MALLNTVIQPNFNWTYTQVLKWLEDNLVIEISDNNGMGEDIDVLFTPFPQEILSYMNNNKNKKTLSNQIIIMIATSNQTRFNKGINGKTHIKKRGYTIPIPYKCIMSSNSYGEIKRFHSWGKNWRILPIDCARKGEYKYECFWNTEKELLNKNYKKPGPWATFLSGEEGRHNSFMVAIALVEDGNINNHIWFSNRLNTKKRKNNK